mmetsp:Transcript_20941/g.67855  ORF Transcript_20941/g.67855 Transcript_20941/m.67855 type:complete len:320 (-) Transcript_20941:361-1320(-)
MTIPIAKKKRAPKVWRIGSSSSTACEAVSGSACVQTSPAAKEPSSIEMPKLSVNVPAARQTPRGNSTLSSCALEARTAPTKWGSDSRSSSSAAAVAAAAVAVWRTARERLAAERKTGRAPRTRPTDRSCVTSTPSISVPSEEETEERACRHRSTTAVDAMHTQRPIKMEDTSGSSKAMAPSSAQAAVVTTCCKNPPMRATCRTCAMRVRSSSTPSVNRMSATPSCASASVWITSLMSEAPCGPAAMPEMRYPSSSGWPRRAAAIPPATVEQTTTTISDTRDASPCMVVSRSCASTYSFPFSSSSVEAELPVARRPRDTL